MECDFRIQHATKEDLMAELTIPFGKYRCKSILAISAEDSAYYEWLKKTAKNPQQFNRNFWNRLLHILNKA